MNSVIFQDQQCAKAKLEIQLKLERFGNDYFYTLGLNKKFCAGIGDFFRLRIILKITSGSRFGFNNKHFSNHTVHDQFSEDVVRIFQIWKGQVRFRILFWCKND